MLDAGAHDDRTPAADHVAPDAVGDDRPGASSRADNRRDHARGQPNPAAASPRPTSEVAEALGRRAGTAIENARLYSERTHIARTLQESLLPPELPDVEGLEVARASAPPAWRATSAVTSTTSSGSGDSWFTVIGD